MRHHSVIFMFILALFIFGLLSGLNMQNKPAEEPESLSNGQVTVNLTHDISHTFVLRDFNISGSTFLDTIGNATISLANVTGFPVGSYISFILNLGQYNNYFIVWINASYLTPSDSNLAGHAQFSTDNVTWTDWLNLGGLPNQSVGFECGRFVRFYFNFTASSDNLTPTISELVLSWQETIPNLVPYFSLLHLSFVNATKRATVSIKASDYEGDLLDVALRYANATIFQENATVLAGSTVYFSFLCSYSTIYTFTISVADGEDSNATIPFSFQTAAAPPPPKFAPFIVLGILGALFAAFFGKKGKK